MFGWRTSGASRPCQGKVVTTLLQSCLLWPVALSNASHVGEVQRARCGTRTTAPCTAPGLEFHSISAGYTHSCGVSNEGFAYCWGDGGQGALGNGASEISQYPKRVLGSYAFVAIAAGGDFSCALDATGDVYCWGNARTVPGWPAISKAPRKVTVSTPARAITAGRRHACILDREHRAWCWGWNVDGETGTGSGGVHVSMIPEPALVSTTERFSAISAGLGFTCGVTLTGNVLCWGSNVDGIIGQDARERCGEVSPIPCATSPVAVPFPERVVQLSSGTGHACAGSRSGAVYCWGDNGAGQAGAFGSGVPSVRVPTRVRLPRNDAVAVIASGGVLSCALTVRRTAYCWGSDMVDVWDHEHLAPRIVAARTQLRSISVGQLHGCGLDLNGRLLCWGDTVLGALGAL